MIKCNKINNAEMKTLQTFPILDQYSNYMLAALGRSELTVKEYSFHFDGVEGDVTFQLNYGRGRIPHQEQEHGDFLEDEA